MRRWIDSPALGRATRMGLGMFALSLLLGGCTSGGATPESMTDQLRNLALGPDGRVRMPIDYVQSTHDPIITESDDFPEGTDGGQVSAIEGTQLRYIACPAVPNSLAYQEHPQWCWAAAVQTVEQYRAFGQDYDTKQIDIVKRVYPEPDTVEDQTALSYQVAQALASEEARQTLTAATAFDENAAPTLDLLKRIVDAKALTDTSTQTMVDYLNQFIGNRELTASLARGEPVLVALAEPSEQGNPLRHIYVIYAANVAPIDREVSRQAKLDRLHRTAQTALDAEDGDFGDDVSKTAGQVTGWIKGLTGDEQMYALHKVFLVDPWVTPGQEPPAKPEIVELSGEEFANRAFFMINRTVADQILAEYTSKQTDAARELDEDVTEEIEESSQP